MVSNMRFNTVAVAIVVVAAFLTGTSGQSNYCSLCNDHTMCLYSGVSSSCNQVLARGVNASDQQTVVDEHNRLRNLVASGQETRGSPGPQPAAADMLKMKWDSELATVAQRWSDQCAFGHDKCRSVQRYSAVGQNVYMSWTTGSIQGAQWKNAVQAWYDEVKDFNRSYVDRYVFDAKYGHYSQVVWGKSNLMGCGYTAYLKSGNRYQYYVCNYAPAGNYIGQPVYKRGTRCSSCPSGCDSTYTSLCV